MRRRLLLCAVIAGLVVGLVSAYNRSASAGVCEDCVTVNRFLTGRVCALVHNNAWETCQDSCNPQFQCDCFVPSWAHYCIANPPI